MYLKTNMDAGHGGASGRFESLKEDAEEYAFLFRFRRVFLRSLKKNVTFARF